MDKKVLQEFLFWVKNQRKKNGLSKGSLYSDRTVEDYYYSLKDVPDFDILNKEPDKALTEIQSYFKDKHELKVYAYRSFLRFLEEKHIDKKIHISAIRRNLTPLRKTTETMNIQRARKERLTKEEIREGIRKIKGFNKKMIIWMLYDTACRVSELISIRKKDLNFTNMTCFIEKGKGNVPKVVKFERSTAKYLKKYVEGMKDDDRIFPYRRGAINKVVNEFGKLIGKKVSPHTFRHTRLSHLAEVGWSPYQLKEYAGWSSIAMTDVYVRLREIAIKTGKFYKSTDLWED